MLETRKQRQPDSRGAATAGVRALLARWRWVALFILVIFASSASLAFCVAAAYQEFGDRAVRAGAYVLLLAAVLTLLGLVLPRIRRRLTPALVTRFMLLAGCYLLALTHMAPYPVEKLHFLEYGFLAFLVWRAFRSGATPDPLFKTVTLVCFVGFVDEIWQGFLPERRYDDQDVLVNFVAASLGLLVTLLLEGRHRSLARIRRLNTVVRQARGFLRPGNLAWLTLWPVGFSIYLLIHSVQAPTRELRGTWERHGDCGVMETLDLKPDGSFAWRDEAGGRATGTYGVKANRLEGIQWGVKVRQGTVANECGWRTGLWMEFRIEVHPDRFVILRTPERPWRRLSAD